MPPLFLHEALGNLWGLLELSPALWPEVWFVPFVQIRVVSMGLFEGEIWTEPEACGGSCALQR